MGSVEIGLNDAPDWSGGTDDEVYGVPDWTSDDDLDGGGANSTIIGIGDDSWDEWDGCVPIAQSMVIAYHEPARYNTDEMRERLIDRLHIASGTNDNEDTNPVMVDNGIENYSHGNFWYNAKNRHFQLEGNVEDGIGNNNPLLLNLINGPYTKDNDWRNGHSVTVVGYEEAGGWYGVGSDFYYKVHNTHADPGADRVLHGDWTTAFVTRVRQGSRRRTRYY